MITSLNINSKFIIHSFTLVSSEYRDFSLMCLLVLGSYAYKCRDGHQKLNVQSGQELYLVPSIVVPSKGEVIYVVNDLKWTILVKKCQFTSTSWASSHPKKQRIRFLVAPRLEEKIEHAALSRWKTH